MILTYSKEKELIPFIDSYLDALYTPFSIILAYEVLHFQMVNNPIVPFFGVSDTNFDSDQSNGGTCLCSIVCNITIFPFSNSKLIDDSVH